MYQRQQTKASGKVYTWRRVLSKKEFRNQEPGGRAGHVQFTLSNKDHRLWVHGGQSEGGLYTNDLFCFDTNKKIWSKHKLQNEPSERAYHTVCMCTPDAETLILKGKKALPRLVMYGGIEKGHLKKELSLLEQWSAFKDRSTFLTKKGSAWTHSEKDFEVKGSVPLPRCNHTMTRLDTGQHLLIFGGWHGKFVNDIYVLDTEFMSWTLKKATSNPRATVEFKVTPRAGHTAIFLPSQSFDRGPKGFFTGPAIVFFGGQTDGGMQLDEVLVLDTTNWEWHRPRPQGREPVARSGHSAVLVGGSKIVFFGGWDGGKVRDDIHVLDVTGDMYTDWSWENQTVKGVKVEGRIGHSAVHIQGKIFIFGGIGKDQQYLGDLNCLDLPLEEIVQEKSKASTPAEQAEPQQQSGFVSAMKRNQILVQKDVEKDLDTKLDEAVQHVSRKIQVLQAQQKEYQDNMEERVAQNLREAKQKSVFQLVQNHGKSLDDAMDIANGFRPEDNRLLNVDSAAKQIVAKYEMPQPPKDLKEKQQRSGNSAWHDAIIGGVEQVALEQIAVNGGLMKTWGALIDDGESEEEGQNSEDEIDIFKATKYENTLERSLEGESLQSLIQQQTERDFAFKQQTRKDYKASQKETSNSPNRRPKRLVNVLGEAPLALTSGDMSLELSKIVNHGAVSTKTHEDLNLSNIMESLPQSKQPVPQGIVDSAMKIKALFIANMHRKRFERLRATVRIQAHVRRFITNCRLKRERSQQEA